MPIPLPTLPGVYYGYVWMSYLGRRTGSVFTFKSTDATTDPAIDAANAQFLADALVTSWITNMLPRYPTAVTGTNSRVYALGHPLVPAAFSFTSSGGAGGDTVAAVPACAVIRHTVFRRGRGSQSHTAISPLQRSEITIDGTSLDPAFITNVTSDFENFIADTISGYTTLGGGGILDYVQLSKKGSGATYLITSNQAEPLVGTERSRTGRP